MRLMSHSKHNYFPDDTTSATKMTFFGWTLLYGKTVDSSTVNDVGKKTEQNDNWNTLKSTGLQLETHDNNKLRKHAIFFWNTFTQANYLIGFLWCSLCTYVFSSNNSQVLCIYNNRVRHASSLSTNQHVAKVVKISFNFVFKFPWAH